MRRRLPLLIALALCACGERPSNEQGLSSERPAETAASPSPAAPPQADPAAYRGAAVAGQVCAQCHDVGSGPPAVYISGATAFSEVARRAETTPESLGAWLRASHPSMPNYIFGETQTADIVAYIMSLRTDR
jgi:mono/diheme cytochrome c family protein